MHQEMGVESRVPGPGKSHTLESHGRVCTDICLLSKVDQGRPHISERPYEITQGRSRKRFGQPVQMFST